MKVNVLTEAQEKKLITLVPVAIKEIIETTERYTEITSDWYTERVSYITSLLEDKKPTEQLVEDIQARLATIKRNQENRKVHLEAGHEPGEIEEITIEGLADIIAKHIIFVNVERTINSKDIEVARAQGDLSENAEYDAAREKQAEIEKAIAEFVLIFEKAEILDLSKVSTKTVSVGTKITYVKSSNKKEYTYKIIGSSQADPDAGIISKDSAVAKALMGKKEGETAYVKVKKQYNSGKPYQIKITKIEKAN